MKKRMTAPFPAMLPPVKSPVHIIMIMIMMIWITGILTGCGAPPEEETGMPPAPPEFTDIAGHPMEEWIREGRERGLYEIPPDGLFWPDSPVTGAEFAVMLWRLAGRPEPSGQAPFADAEGRSGEVRDALSWLRSGGYCADGGVDGFFPDEPVTRQAAMSVLFAHNGGVSGLEALLTGIYDDAFIDSGQIADWAKNALYWGYFKTFLTVEDPHTIDPDGVIPRGEAAKIMIRYGDFMISEADRGE